MVRDKPSESSNQLKIGPLPPHCTDPEPIDINSSMSLFQNTEYPKVAQWDPNSIKLIYQLRNSARSYHVMIKMGRIIVYVNDPNLVTRGKKGLSKLLTPILEPSLCFHPCT